ncbi:unnamed protein product [Adineta ricciae]|uniref:Knr4/Smi1-like domain-containing protein n=1 Tax=Adineta ricciae TaxID=249248 RepID=A0A814PU65_ADIRI|nr:unnamed protein product [Adineta ricciae]CAF1605381.1 unnamed protein product [Adineta ricciae]
MASSNHPGTDDSIRHVTEHWKKLNENLAHVPKFQSVHQAGVTEEQLKQFESKLNITLPKEIRAVIKVHDGRKHIGFGLGYRLPSTDLLPLSEWKPYEKENEDFVKELCDCLSEEDNACVDKHLYEDFQEHTKIYKQDKGKSSTAEELFGSVPCELLIIGQGMDDYAEQYLLSIRSGRIYLAIHNIPEWKLIGSFEDWINKGLSHAEDQKAELEEQHEEAEVA